MEILKKKYTIPRLELIVLDNEIALVLESNPPIGPYESANTDMDYFENNPYKTSNI